MANDVKVTLSADDLATEVVRRLGAAVKALGADQAKANAGTKDAATHAKTAKGAFGEFKNAIVGVAAALAALRVVSFIKNTIEATDQIGKLALKTGASTEALSVLAVAASTADLSQEELGNGLKFLSRSVVELGQGIPATVEAFASIGLSAKELKGLSLDQVLVRIANAQAKFGDGAGKTAALLKIFGRSGEELIPLLHDLSNGGFDEAAKKAKDLGLVISSDTAKAAQDFNDNLTTLKNAVKGLVVALTPLIKGIGDAANGLALFISHHGELVAFAATALTVGFAVNGIAKAFLALRVATAGAGIAALFTVPGVIIASLAALAGAIGLIISLYQEAKQAKEALEAPLNTDPALNRALGIDKPKPDVNLTDPAQRKALIDAQLAATKQGLKDQLDATQAGLKLQEQADEAAFAQGLISLRAFYTDKLAITKQGVAAQVAELQAQKQALSATPLAENTEAERIKRATELKAIEAQIAKLKVDGQAQVLALIEQQRVAELALKTELQGLAQTIARASGDEISAQQIEIEQTVERFRLALSKISGLSKESIDQQANDLSNLLTNRAAFDEKRRQAERQLVDLGLERDRIQAKADQGLISQRTATEQIAALEQSRLPALQDAADLMLKFAQETGDPALIQAAQQFAAEFENIGKVVQESTKLIAELGESIRDAGKNAIAGFLTTGVTDFLSKDTSQLDSLKGQLESAQKEMDKLLKGPPTDAAGNRITQLRQEMGNLNAEIQTAKDTLPTIGNAVRESLLSAVQAVQRAIADILAAQFVEKLSKFFGASTQVASTAPQLAAATALSTAGGVIVAGATGLSGASTALAGSGGVLLSAASALAASAAALAGAGAATALTNFGVFGAAFASGGPVRGPGTSTSDSIPARLSVGEYVIRAASVKRVGLDLLNAINFGGKMPTLRRPHVAGLPAFATGGLVSAGSGSSSVDGGIDATFGLEDGLVLKHLNTRGGLKLLGAMIERNPQFFKAKLGIA